MRVLTTHCGRYGDALWAMPTIRAISETLGEPVDFCISGAYGSLAPLIQEQDYINRAWGEETWAIRETAPITPPEPPSIPASYDKVFHLSMKGWPVARNMAEGYWLSAREMLPGLKPLDLERPWIKVPETKRPYENDKIILVGFSDHWVELKMGIVYALTSQLPMGGVRILVCSPPESRINKEWVPFYWLRWPEDWLGLATLMNWADLFLGCLSAPWVLANAMGRRTVIVEPMEGRHAPIFWLEAERNHMVMGGDGKPSFDGRATVQLVKQVLGVA